jgi:predicted amidohydrolase YtcJ
VSIRKTSIFPQAEAVLIHAGRIAAIGSNDQIRSAASPESQVIDLEGHLALPGLTDAHFHFHDWSLSRRDLLLAGVGSIQDLQASLSKAARSAPPGKWILGQGWKETAWADQRLPNRDDLDHAAPQSPSYPLAQ